MFATFSVRAALALQRRPTCRLMIVWLLLLLLDHVRTLSPAVLDSSCTAPAVLHHRHPAVAAVLVARPHPRIVHFHHHIQSNFHPHRTVARPAGHHTQFAARFRHIL
jgi:hypothetical protein